MNPTPYGYVLAQVYRNLGVRMDDGRKNKGSGTKQTPKNAPKPPPRPKPQPKGK